MPSGHAVHAALDASPFPGEYFPAVQFIHTPTTVYVPFGHRLVGIAIESKVGEGVGSNEGVEVGVRDGADDGINVGSKEGAEVGVKDGAGEGVGSAVGRVVGRSVGNEDGESVVSTVGSFVGATVGTEEIVKEEELEQTVSSEVQKRQSFPETLATVEPESGSTMSQLFSDA